MAATIKAPSKNGRSKTGPQVLFRPVETINKTTGVLTELNRGSLTYAKVREMRKDPTISMVRQLIIAPPLMAPWEFKEMEGAPSGSGKFIEEQIAELRSYLVRTCLFGCIDYGWQSFEKVFGTNDQGQVVLQKMKAMLPDYTDILVNSKNGAFWGLRERNVWTGADVLIRLKKSFVHAFDVEGTYWYGSSYMANAESTYDQWDTANDANVRYDAKIAGSHWVIHYPMGISFVNGTEKDNEEIAQEVLAALESSGGIAVPKKIEEFIGELDKETPNAWEIELLSDKGATQTNFLERMAYLDKLKVRAFGFPERSILEGKYGTKAEAETHADFAVTNVLIRGTDFVRDLNWHLIDQILELNYGPEAKGTVRIVAGSIGGENKEFLRSVYTELIKDPKGFTSEFAKLDMKTLRKVLMIPVDAGDEDETDLFEKELEKLEEKADNPDPVPPMLGGDPNALLDPNGPGDDLREDERNKMGRPRERWGPNGGRGSDKLGDPAGGRENRRPPEKPPLRRASDDDTNDDN